MIFIPVTEAQAFRRMAMLMAKQDNSRLASNALNETECLLEMQLGGSKVRKIMTSQEFHLLYLACGNSMDSVEKAEANQNEAMKGLQEKFWP